MNSFETLLQMLSSTFLDDDDHPASLPDLLAAISTHQATFTTLPISLSQATYEFRYRGSGLIEGYGRAVGGLTRLAQCLTGLRAGCGPVVEGLEAEKDVLGLFRERVASDLRNLTVSLVSFLESYRPLMPPLASLGYRQRSVRPDGRFGQALKPRLLRPRRSTLRPTPSDEYTSPRQRQRLRSGDNLSNPIPLPKSFELESRL